MTGRELQKSGENRLAQRQVLRGLPAQVNTVLLHPALFYRTLAPMSVTRQWLWMALLLMAVVGFNAVRLQTQSQTSSNSVVPADMGGMTGVEPGMDIGGISAVPPDMGVDPGIVQPVGDGGFGSGVDTTTQWTTALVAASGLLLMWLIQAVLLSEVSLLNGSAPRLGHNFQVAIWASLPLGLMALVQILYQAAGGAVGKPGLSGLVEELPFYAAWSPFAQSVLLSFASNLTLFWLWGLMLIYFGARYALHGRRWAAMLVLMSWVIVLTMIPVVTGRIEVQAEDAVLQDDMEFSQDGMIPSEMEIIPGEDPTGLDIFPEATAAVPEATESLRPQEPSRGSDS